MYDHHWKGSIGYRVVKGFEKFNHFFGDETWNLPICPNCNTKLHQILTFDLQDDRLSELRDSELNELPLVSCLNCSLAWEHQYFKIIPEQKKLNY